MFGDTGNAKKGRILASAFEVKRSYFEIRCSTYDSPNSSHIKVAKKLYLVMLISFESAYVMRSQAALHRLMLA